MEKMRSYRLELKLNKSQRVLCAKSAGTSRFAYNWQLHILNEKYQKAKQEANGGKIKCKLGTAIDWHKDWVILKDELPWIRETSKCCGQEALRDLFDAFQRFFNKKSGYPKFKKKGEKDSFRLDGSVYIASDYVQLPIIGKVKLKEKNYPILEGKCLLKQATVSRQADRWFVSFLLPELIEDPILPALDEITSEDIIGVDLGIKELAITSEGETFENPKALKRLKRKLKKKQKECSRKKKGSNNYKKAKVELSKIHKRIADIRKDSVHKLTTSLVKTKPKVIVIETLKPKNMMKNHKLAGAIADANFGRVKETLKYKCKWNGIILVFAPMFYASSQYCSVCGHKHKGLTLKDREWTCEHCKTHHDRDVNAAANLKFFALWLLDLILGDSPANPSPSGGGSTVSSTGSNACGDERLQFLTEQCSSMKQDFKVMYDKGLPSFA